MKIQERHTAKLEDYFDIVTYNEKTQKLEPNDIMVSKNFRSNIQVVIYENKNTPILKSSYVLRIKRKKGKAKEYISKLTYYVSHNIEHLLLDEMEIDTAKLNVVKHSNLANLKVPTITREFLDTFVDKIYEIDRQIDVLNKERIKLLIWKF